MNDIGVTSDCLIIAFNIVGNVYGNRDWHTYPPTCTNGTLIKTFTSYSSLVFNNSGYTGPNTLYYSVFKGNRYTTVSDLAADTSYQNSVCIVLY